MRCLVYQEDLMSAARPIKRILKMIDCGGFDTGMLWTQLSALESTGSYCSSI